jgi:hypothetical protein
VGTSSEIWQVLRRDEEEDMGIIDSDSDRGEEKRWKRRKKKDSGEGGGNKCKYNQTLEGRGGVPTPPR